MAAMVSSLAMVSNSQKKSKRLKLLIGQSVEVRSTEDGFQGSWHPASIIECGDSVCRVRYDHILVDDESGYLTELIHLSNTIQSVYTKNPVNYRGLIRPTPPNFEVKQWGLHYGLCVDAYVNEGWWEGVIFDHNDGFEVRSVFFPDIGDEQIATFENLRITQDWDEVSKQWNIRGDWLFLQVVEEELEREWPLPVSLKQLWYDIRTKEDFRNGIKEWTCLTRTMWSCLVLDVIGKNIELTAEHALGVIEGTSNPQFSLPTLSLPTRLVEAENPLSVVEGLEQIQPKLFSPKPEEAEHPIGVIKGVEEIQPMVVSSRPVEEEPAQSVIMEGVEEIQPTLASHRPLEDIDSKYNLGFIELGAKRRKTDASADTDQVKTRNILGRQQMSKQNQASFDSNCVPLSSVGNLGLSCSARNLPKAVAGEADLDAPGGVEQAELDRAKEQQVHSKVGADQSDEPSSFEHILAQLALEQAEFRQEIQERITALETSFGQRLDALTLEVREMRYSQKQPS